MITTLKCVPGFIWALPASILGWIFFCIPSWRKGVFSDIWINKYLCITWEIDKGSDFYKEYMVGWFGFSVGCNRVVVDIALPTREAAEGIVIGEIPEDHPDYIQMKHELKHVFQNYTWGVFFFPFYILMTCFIWLFLKDKHAYLDNPFEVEARRFAGQKVFIPRDEWVAGVDDRFPWW